jgi:hypothetical protein
MYIGTCRVHMADPHKYTPDMLTLSTARKKKLLRKKRNRAFEDIGHTTRHIAFWRADHMFGICLFWVREDKGSITASEFWRDIMWKQNLIRSIWFQRVELRLGRSRFLF